MLERSNRELYRAKKHGLRLPHYVRNDNNYYFRWMKIHLYYVYILTNKSNTVLYVGVTNDLQNRVSEHKIYKGFTAKYECNKLVYYEEYQWIQDAIAREKQLKAGSRQKKIDLITVENPLWNDLSADWYD
ncbi:GIY-YIG nuclease family protein [Mucilaginibacter sp. McL0603]|uniref:GIY-YIG nuclease family protein n=1 Tax=Mucilaginibacter sp. McL0603 TaxID=3415670 RepID=UPI003CFA4C9B